MEFIKCITIMFFVFLSSLLLNILSYCVILLLVICLILLLKKLSTLPTPNHGFANICPSIMIILGSGGHTWEMFKILSLLKNDFNYLPLYIVANGDTLSGNFAKYFETNFSRRYFIDKVIRPRNSSKESLLSFTCFTKSVICFFQSIKLILSHQPDHIIGNGPSTCVPVMLAAWFLNSLGITKITLIYIESMARLKSLSISAKILRPFVNDMFTLWTEMCDTFKLSPLAYISINKLESSSLHIYDEKCNGTKKTAFVTVGTTEFDNLINVIFDNEFQTSLIILGFSKVILQVGSRSQYRVDDVNFNILPQLKFKIVSVVNEESFMTILRKSDLIISHGGAGTLFQALELQKSIIAIVNPKTVGNHQCELINYLKESGYIHSCSVRSLNHCLRNDYYNQPLKYKLKISSLNDAFTSKIGQNYVNIFPSVVTEGKREKFSIVIPSLISNEPQLKILLISLREFLDTQSVDRIYIIVPKQDLVHFSTLIRSLTWQNVQITIISETDLVPECILSLCDIQLKSRSGWFKQQIIKLKAADIVHTDFYVILDSDCILRRPLTYANLIYANETGHNRSYLQIEEIFKHPRWYKGSSRLLGITTPFINNLKGIGIGVTPQTLSVHIVKEMTNFLQEAHQVFWPILLAKNRFQLFPQAIWTEYTLYYLFAERTGLLAKCHVLGRNNIANYYQSVWTKDQVNDWNSLGKFTSSPAPFVIFQSKLGLGAEMPSTFIENLISKRNTLVPIRRRRKIYFICSELEFYPVVGGINTFIRVIITSFQELAISHPQNVELIFCGLKCGDTKSLKECPSISGISFKFFTTSGSSQAADLACYFKSFSKFSTLTSDMQEFGEQCTNWILSDCQPGDVCVTTIVYELNLGMIQDLVSSGLKIVHTVHSLVARKAMATLRAVPIDKFHFLDKLRASTMRYILWNEKALMTLYKMKCLSWAIPKVISENLAVESFIMENSKAILVPSKQLTEITASLYMRAKDRIHYAPWGLPESGVLGEYFEINYHPKKPPTNDINCLALCKIIPQKGIDVLINALKKIEQMDFNLSQRIKLKICGDMSYMNVSTYFLNLRNRCESLTTIEVEFTGWLEGQAKWDVMNQSDLLLVPSLTEPFGFSVIEAMKVGMGVISFETEGPLDIVELSFGRLVPLDVDVEVMATNFALAIIDICYSSGSSDGFRQLKEAAKFSAKKWNMQAFFDALLSMS